MSSSQTLTADTLFYSQLSITVVGMIFTGALIIIQPDNLNVYLPIFSSLLFSWLPSPISTRNIQSQLKEVEDKIAVINHKIVKKNMRRTTDEYEEKDNLV
jgi:hypothetical protein